MKTLRIGIIYLHQLLTIACDNAFGDCKERDLSMFEILPTRRRRGGEGGNFCLSLTNCIDFVESLALLTRCNSFGFWISLKFSKYNNYRNHFSKNFDFCILTCCNQWCFSKIASKNDSKFGRVLQYIIRKSYDLLILLSEQIYKRSNSTKFSINQINQRRRS